MEINIIKLKTMKNKDTRRFQQANMLRSKYTREPSGSNLEAALAGKIVKLRSHQE